MGMGIRIMSALLPFAAGTRVVRVDCPWGGIGVVEKPFPEKGLIGVRFGAVLVWEAPSMLCEAST